MTVVQCSVTCLVCSRSGKLNTFIKEILSRDFFREPATDAQMFCRADEMLDDQLLNHFAQLNRCVHSPLKPVIKIILSAEAINAK